MRRFVLLFFVTIVLLLLYKGSETHLFLWKAEAEPPVVLSTQLVADDSNRFVWWEAEQPQQTNFPENNPFAPANATEANLLSDNAWIGVEGTRSETLFLKYTVTIPDAGDYFFYSRKFWQHGPFRWRWDDQPWQSVGSRVHLMDDTSIRPFLVANWVSLGQVRLAAGSHTFQLELTQKEGAAAFDCFVLTQTPFQARGKLKPNERLTANLSDWFIFDPAVDSFQDSPIDLRNLNEAIAGENGFIQVQGESFVHGKNSRPVRFWAINVGEQALLMNRSQMAYMARFLAKRGVNMVRIHSKLWADNFRTLDPALLDGVFALTAALKQEGIYTTLSIYFPLWLQLNPDSGLAGYNQQHPFSLLFFNTDFQQVYRGWWRSLLTSVNPYTGIALQDDPAVAMVELLNEDSYFFWTFNAQNVPLPQMQQLEAQFGQWLQAKYGSIQQAITLWGVPLETAQQEAGRVSLLMPADLIQQRDSRRAQDTAAFLTSSQQQFFQSAIAFLRQDLHYRGLIYASNWVTADARILGPLDKYSNTVADFMDRHGYFAGPHTGDAAAYSVHPGDRYQDRSALRFPSLQPDQAHDFDLPIMDIRYNGKPSTITEVNWSMPNRFRAEFPFLAAAYGALQDTDGYFFFANNKQAWDSLGKFSIASPAVMGQFPAAAFLYRQGLVQAGQTVADITLNLDEILALKGAPVTAPQNLDQFRAQNIPPGELLQSRSLDPLDPLAFLVGKVNVQFSQQATVTRQRELSPFIDRQAKTVRSSTGELFWDYNRGLLTVNAPAAQGVTGFLQQAKSVELSDLSFSSDLEYGAMMLVALDQKPIAQSSQMLLQVMSEEKNLGWQTIAASPGSADSSLQTIQAVGHSPILVHHLQGEVRLKRSDAARLKVTALDVNGYPQEEVGNAEGFNLLPHRLYYLIQK